MAKADEHIIETKDCESVLVRDSKYRDNTKKEAWMKTEDVLWQAHHILCNHSVDGREFPQGDEAFGEACLWITKWDLNDAHNMIGLPLNRQYREQDGKVPKNLPSHQVDHNTTGGYTEECTEWLKSNVWNKIKDKGKAHQANATNMRTVLRDASDYFRGELEKRGIRKTGTLYCWNHRFEDPPDTWTKARRDKYEWEPKWYQPFSMAKTSKVNERQPGEEWDNLVGILRKIA